MSTFTALSALRAGLDDETRWTRAAFARNSGGGSCKVDDPDAVRWCLLGHLHRGITHHADRTDQENSDFDTDLTVAEGVLYAACRELYGGDTSPTRINDELGLPAARRLVERALELVDEPVSR